MLGKERIETYVWRLNVEEVGAADAAASSWLEVCRGGPANRKE